MKPNRKNLFFAIITVALSAPSAHAVNLYWDTNGTEVSDSGAATGTWGTDAFWSTDSTGNNVGPVTLTATTTSADDLFFSAGTTGTGGTLTLSANQDANSLTFEEGAVTLSANTIALAAGGITVATGAGDAIISSSLTATGTRTYNVGAGRILTVNGVFTGGIVKSGTGTMTLGGSATHSTTSMTVDQGVLITNSATGEPFGNATINNGGTLQWGADNKFNNGAAFTINAGGILDISNRGDLVGSFNGAGAITGTGLLQVQGGTSNFTGLISGTGLRLNLWRDAPATVTLSNSNTYTGTTTIERGTLNINSIGNANGTASAIGAPTTAANGRIAMGQAANTGTLVYTGGATETNRVINLAGTTGGATITQSGTGLLKFTSALVATGAGRKTLTLSGSTAGTGEIAAAIVNNSGANLTSVTKDGTGTWVLSGANTYTGATAINGGTLQIGNGGTTGTLGSGAVTIASGAFLTINRSNNYGTGNNQSFSGAGTLVKEGAGDLIFNGTSDHTAAQGIENLTINGGLVRTDFFGKWNSNLNLTASGSGILELWNANTSLGTLNGNGTVRNTQHFGRDNTTLTVAAGAFSGTITDTGGAALLHLVKAGSGTLTLSGANTYTGTTLISGGTLQIGDGIGSTGSIATASAITNDATLRINRGGALDLANNISGTGNLVKDFATGDLILNGNNSYGGGTSVNAGRLFINTANSLPTTGNVTVANGATLAFNVNGTYNQSISLADGGKLSVRAGAATLGNVTLPTAGSVIFNHDDAATSAFSLGSNVTLTGNLTVQVGGAGGNPTVGIVTLGGVISGGFGLTKTQVGVLALSGANDYTGDTTVSDGTLAVNGTALPDGTKLTINAGNIDLTNAETVNTLFFGVVQQPAGVYSASSVPSGATITTASFTGSGTLIVSTGPVTNGYAAWQTANSTAQTIDLDHDNDGVSNGVEYFLGGNTNTTGFTALPGVTNDAGTLSITWVRHPDFPSFPGNYGTAVMVETSATLTNPWTPAVEGVGAGFVEITGNNVKYTFHAGTKNFARLKVIEPAP